MPDLKLAKDFWQWFEKNQQVLVKEFSALDEASEQGQTDDENLQAVEKVLGEIMDRLHKYDDRLFPYCGIDEDGGVEFIVTAEGNVAAFESAHQLISAAPELDSWSFIALKPRTDDTEAGFIVHSDGEAAGDLIKYCIAKYGGEVLLVLVFDVDADEIDEEMAYLGLSMVENLLGEQDLATGFDGIDVMTRKQFSDSGKDWVLADLSNLVAEFDQRSIH